ncbi:hypothetical protein RZS08_03465, partial [Arthrospira platensis SPKY1]|nr:hypothetical protein [Arthrospira platensis SPKY1]
MADAQVDLIYADPPFFTGKNFTSSSAKRPKRGDAPTAPEGLLPGVPAERGCPDPHLCSPPEVSGPRDVSIPGSDATLFSESTTGRGFTDCWRGGIESYLAFLRPRLEEIDRKSVV